LTQNIKKIHKHTRILVIPLQTLSLFSGEEENKTILEEQVVVTFKHVAHTFASSCGCLWL